MALPTFDAIPVIQDRSGVRVGYVSISGLSTKSSGKSDRGRLYASFTDTGGGTYTVDIYSAFSLAALTKVLSGVAPAIGEYFDLVAANDSGMTGTMRLDGSGSVARAILIVSLATDRDVFKDETAAAAMPGYDATYGLAEFHAAAMRQILTSDLPAALPNLYHDTKLATYIPLSGVESLPDLTTIQTPESLRDAQAALVKAMSAREKDYLAEFEKMAQLASDRYADLLLSFTAANAPASVEVAAEANVISFGTFTRG